MTDIIITAVLLFGTFITSEYRVYKRDREIKRLQRRLRHRRDISAQKSE